MVITDLDSGIKNDPKKAASAHSPARGIGLVTLNNTLKSWVPKLEGIDELLDANEEARTVVIDKFSGVLAAYQLPVLVEFSGNGLEGCGEKEEALAYTFEDALAIENLETFRTLEGVGLVAKFRKSIGEAEDLNDLIKKFHNDVRGGDKGKFALDVIFGVEPSKLKVPSYMRSGLAWLEKQLERQDEQNLVRKKVAEAKKVEGGIG